jgi:hypothetical protein
MKISRTLSRVLLSRPTQISRALFSTSVSSKHGSDHYQKQQDASPEVVTRPDGRKAYVVSHPEESDKTYDVPSGPFPTTSPNLPFEVASESPPEIRRSSTSASPGHPTTTRQAVEQTLTDRNPPPDETQGKTGLHAWKDRK